MIMLAYGIVNHQPKNCSIHHASLERLEIWTWRDYAVFEFLHFTGGRELTDLYIAYSGVVNSRNYLA